MNNKLNFLRMYYHVSNNKELRSALISDFFSTIFFIGGSGIFLSFFRGIYYQLLLNYIWPALIGWGFKIINPKNFVAGSNIWMKDGVFILAAGKISLGNNCVLCERVFLWAHDKGLKVGNDVAIGIGSYISATGGSINIGNEVRIADHVRMYSFDHKFSNTKKTIASQGYSRQGITVEDNVWIGSGAIILDGVKVGRNSVIAAGSVVTKSIPPNVLVAGVPAKIIRKLNNDK